MNITFVSSSGVLDRLWSWVQSKAGALFTNLVAIFFYFGTRALFNIQVHGLHNFSASPSTIIVTSHKKDLDEIIIPPTLHVRKTLFHPRLRMWFAARDDLFDRGFLSNHFLLPSSLSRLLSNINLSVVMAAFRAQPIGRLTGSQVGSILRNVYEHVGNVALKDVLTAECITEFARLLPTSLNSNLHNIRLKNFLSYDYHLIHAQKSNLSILQSDVLGRIRSFLLDKIKSQLSRFSNILDEGNILFFTPSDDHSPDGRFGPTRSGIYRLIRIAQTDVRILPVNIDYDPMTTGRMRIHVTIGPEIINLKGYSKSEFESLLQEAIKRLGVVNMSQLGSYLLLRLANDNSGVTTKEQLARSVLSQVQKLSNLGLSVDNVLTDHRLLGKHLDKFIKYYVKKRWLRCVSDGKLILNKEAILDLKPSRHGANPIRYSCNELMTYQSAYQTPISASYNQ